MANQYKLTYFNVRGLGDQIRILLHDNNIPFEDHRFPFEDWPKIKPTLQFGQAPVLFDGDMQLVQSSSIMRHLARKHGLDGETEDEKVFVDMFYEGIVDLRSKYLRMIYQEYETEKENFIKNLPAFLDNYAKMLGSKNGGKAGFVSGNKITYTDYLLFDFLCVLQTLAPSCLDKYPILKDYHQFINKRPSLASYLSSDARLKTPINGNRKQ